MSFQEVPALLLNAARLAVLVVLPLLASAVMTFVLRRVRNAEFEALPVLTIIANLAGLAAGLLLIAGSDLAPIFRLGMAFDKDGPWGISWEALLTERLRPSHYSPFGLSARLDAAEPGWFVSVLRWVPAAGLFAAAAIAIRAWGGGEALRAIGAVLVLFTWATAMTVYVIASGLWLLNVLNFWALAIVLLLLYFRSTFR